MLLETVCVISAVADPKESYEYATHGGLGESNLGLVQKLL